MDRDPSEPGPQPDLPQDGLPVDGLEVLIDLALSEAPEAEGTGWEVTVVEHLRLQVPADAREIWVEAELQTWDPWLRAQKGFVGREVLWDNHHQEGVLLIHWANRQDWKAIPEAMVAAVQESFEAAAKQMLSLPPHSDNPFPLVFAGETSR
ncbi:MAG: TIGR03792 family protein [Cyanobium sp.]